MYMSTPNLRFLLDNIIKKKRTQLIEYCHALNYLPLHILMNYHINPNLGYQGQKSGSVTASNPGPRIRWPPGRKMSDKQFFRELNWTPQQPPTSESIHFPV